MKKRAWKQNTWVAGLSLLIYLTGMTASPTMAAVGNVRSSQKISATSGNFTNTLAADDDFGISVARISDLNGDGVADLAVGARLDGAGNAGAVYVLFMNANGTVNSSQKISATSGNFTNTLDASDYFGIGVAGIGDLNGDGVADLAVGAFGDDDGAANAGAVYVLFLNTNGTVNSSRKISATSGNFTNTLILNDFFGVSVAGIGDLNGDGVADLAAGAYGDDDGAGNAGALYVLFMNTNGTVNSSRKISKTSGNFTNTLDASDYFGIAVAGIGDLNGDGVADLAAGAFGDDDGAADVGALYVLFMNTNGTVNSSQKISATSGGLTNSFPGTNRLDASDEFGRSVAGIGDLNGGGVADLAAGATLDDDGADGAGAVYVLFLNTNGTVNSSQKISKTSGNFTNTLDALDDFGISTAGIGDWNGDGFADLAAGANLDDDGAANAGALYILMLEGPPPPRGTIFKFH